MKRKHIAKNEHHKTSCASKTNYSSINDALRDAKRILIEYRSEKRHTNVVIVDIGI
jgi:hypothetical protein